MGKEEDKIERIIRGLIKLAHNKRCINCNSLGPQYVCTTFWTFVCTNCSGVHREFTHRVKSVSMAKFTMEEVNCLQAGGNEKARDIYFKSWNPHRNFFPDNSNIQKLRDFIKQVYVDRRYSGDNNPVLLPRLTNSDKDESYSARQDAYRERERATDRHGRYAIDEIRSPGYPREANERHNRYATDEVRSPGYPRETNERNGRYSNIEVRSPGYSRENSRYGGLRAASSRFEGTDGRYQVDDARIAGRSATQMFTTEDIKLRSRDLNSPPPVRNVRDLLGEKSVSMSVGDQAKRSVFAAANAKVGEYGGQNSPRQTGDLSKTAHRRSVSAYVQNTARSGNQIPASNDSLKPKGGSEGSLVDFALFPPPPPPPDTSIQNQNQALQIQTPNDATNSTSSEPPVKENVNKAPPRNTLEFLLFELSTPAEITPSDQSGAPTDQNAVSAAPASNTLTSDPVSSQSNHTNDPPNLQLALTSAQEYPNTPSPSAVSTNSIFSTANTGMPRSRHVEKPNVVATPQMVPDFFGDNGVPESSSAAPQTSHLHENFNNQTANFFPASSAGVAFDNFTAQSSKPADDQVPETKSAVDIQPSPGVAKSRGRPELPEDLFASPYPSTSVSAPVCQMSPSYGMGFNMQFYQNASMQIPPFSNVTKSVNPFDTDDDAAQQQFTMNPSTPELQGGMPNVSASSAMLRAQSFGSHFQGFPSAQSPSYDSYQPGAYMGQYSFSNIPSSRQQGIGGFSGGGVTLVSSHLNQQLPYQYTAPADPRSFPTGGGNPFG